MCVHTICILVHIYNHVLCVYESEKGNVGVGVDSIAIFKGGVVRVTVARVQNVLGLRS